MTINADLGVNDGTLVGTVPRDLPAGTEIEIRLGVWPGEITVYVKNVIVNVSRLEVNLDIKPGSDPNAVNPKSRGVIPVAILHTNDFDPTQRVDVSTLRFGVPDVVDTGGGARPAHTGGHIEDVDKDGDDDLVLHFPTQNTGFSSNDNVGKLVGKTKDGTPLFATDRIKSVGR